MPATGREISRRTLLLALAATTARADDPAQEGWEMVTRLAAALGRGDAADFLGGCDRAMPGYDTLRVNVSALTAQVDANSGIDPVRNEGDGQSRELEVDWTLRLVDRTGLGRITNRRENVKCRVAKRGKSWKVVLLEPVGFFAPPSA
jgi:hypothetical protein